MNFQIKHAVAAVILAGIFGGAQAATVSLNGASFPYDLGADPTAANSYSVTHDAGSFSDVFNFTLSQASDTISSAVSLYLPGINGSSAFYNITNGTLSLYQGGSNTLLGSTNWGSTNGVLSVNNVAAGSYYWKVAGDAVGLNGGVYLYAADTAPVPEPSTYLMMLLGLGFLGFVAKRQLGNLSMGTPLGMA
ncbi:uncharacterized protein NMK_2614 [Novimethylophilus kurashikiensis]|uniref:Ice-binding protein C-terminal domain-containing protein n=1 Tax=Novimethylophilus kurashikiensis TaxID=1825523 RepID=A0A2R5FDY1_9PROT|nr:FxDxF family PEP-CTERM protein [Novimethylophilus kurashikiensis]GBG15013.1 uncharacterized protein NMK_2614 [Novimethylophilus kurashikiensis]